MLAANMLIRLISISDFFAKAACFILTHRVQVTGTVMTGEKMAGEAWFWSRTQTSWEIGDWQLLTNLTHQTECFQNLLDLICVSIGKGAHWQFEGGLHKPTVCLSQSGPIRFLHCLLSKLLLVPCFPSVWGVTLDACYCAVVSCDALLKPVGSRETPLFALCSLDKTR